jgi:23S rRNA pseudouridine2605 synthase
MEDDSVRLQVLLAEAGIGSRRHCERLIAEGRVRVNGVVADRLGTKASRQASIEVDGKPAAPPADKVYIMLNKPKGYISSAKEQFGRKTVFDLLPAEPPEAASRLFSVGRLDCDTTGLLLLTNDGEFANRVAHPSGEIEKTYEAVVHAPATPEMLDMLRSGVRLGDGGDGFVTSPARAWAGGGPDGGADADRAGQNGGDAGTAGPDSGAGGDLCNGGSAGGSSRNGAGAGQNGAQRGGHKVTVAIHEGKNRQVRRMLAAVGLRTDALKRVAIGGLWLGGLAEGAWRRISRDDAVRAIFGQK